MGHGTLPAEQFVTLVRRRNIARIVDVRSFPGSRRNPQYGREAMAAWLEDAGVAYEWEQRLGGRRRNVAKHSRHTALRHEAFRSYADWMETDEFRAGLRTLIAELPGTAPPHDGGSPADPTSPHGDVAEPDDTSDHARAEQGAPPSPTTGSTAFLCSESLWWRCHRRLLSDHLVLVEGIEVVHLFHDGRVARHESLAEARVEDHTVVYDGGAAALGL